MANFLTLGACAGYLGYMPFPVPIDMYAPVANPLAKLRPQWVQLQFETVVRRERKPDPKGDHLYLGMYGLGGVLPMMFQQGFDPANPDVYKDFKFTREDVARLYETLHGRLEAAGRPIRFTAYCLPPATLAEFSREDRIKYLRVIGLRDAQARVQWNIGPWD